MGGAAVLACKSEDSAPHRYPTFNFNLGRIEYKPNTGSFELIEPVGGPSTWKEHLDTKGEGVHHIAFRIKGMVEQVAMLEKKGMPAVQRGDFTGGRYAYIDSAPQLGGNLGTGALHQLHPIAAAEVALEDPRQLAVELFEDEAALQTKIEQLVNMGVEGEVADLCEFCQRSLQGIFGRHRELYRGKTPPEAAWSMSQVWIG